MKIKDYELIAGAIHRSGMALSIKDNNKVKQQARNEMKELIVADLGGTLKNDNPLFDKYKFYGACGVTTKLYEEEK